MFKPWQVIVFLILFLALVAGAFYWYYSSPVIDTETMMDPSAIQDGTMTDDHMMTDGTAMSGSGATIDARATTDADLDADLKTIDGQLQAVGTNSAAVEQSLNDQPVEQTE